MRLLASLVVLAVTFGQAVWGQCTVPINELKETTPVFFRNGEYMAINEGNLTWACGEVTYVTCAESPFKNYPFANSAYIQCHGGKNFVVGDLIRHIDYLECNYTFRGFKEPGDDCYNSGRQGKWHHFGFDGEHGFRTYFKTCYDMVGASALYSEHVLQGSVMRYVTPIERKTGFVKGLVPIENVRTLYTQQHTEEVFDAILGPKQLEKIKAVSYLARGHLNPNADGVMPYFMRSTFYFDNVIPQWQNINLSNWKRVENIARTLAKLSGRDLRIMTGAEGVLELLDDWNVTRRIYLRRNLLEVPKWLWKVIKDEERDESIMFVTFNNPFRAPTSEEMLCPDVCDAYGYGKVEFANYSKGYTYCCALVHRSSVSIVPVEGFANGVLRNVGTSGVVVVQGGPPDVTPKYSFWEFVKYALFLI